MYFMNNGDFDVRAMLTMGLSAKAEDSIGFFGTGFKYAVSIILRLGGSIKVSTLSGEYEFTVRNEEVRGKEFGIVYVNDREAGFTTHLGANWEPWMAYRELYCNAKDEGGEVSFDKGDFDTIIEVRCAEVEKAHHESGMYFLRGSPLSTYYAAEIHEKRPFIYYKGIAVKEAGDLMYSYNILCPITLTEDRTARSEYEIRYAIQQAVQNCTDEAMLRRVLRSGEHTEARMSFDECWGVSDAFLRVSSELLATDAGLCEGARKILEKRNVGGNWPEFEPNNVQQKMLDKAKAFLEGIEIDVDRFPLKLVRGLGDGVMGRAFEGTIYLSEVPFHMGTKQVASTLLEEWVHLKYGVKDFDRQMQSWLFDKILSLGETINGEPV